MYSRINNDESSVGGLILAAGLSTRMGQSKPLTKFLDKKLIDQTIKTMQEAGIDKIQIVTGFEHERVEAYLQDNYSSDHIHTIWNPNYGNGSILTSIKTGLAELTDYELVFIQLVDLPCIMSKTIGSDACEWEKSSPSNGERTPWTPGIDPDGFAGRHSRL